MKTKHDTPKYGLLYHASLVGQATGKNKGKIARVLAAKAAVSLRYDALAEERDDSGDVGLECRAKVENRLSQLEGRDLRTTPRVVREAKKVEIKGTGAYNTDADAVSQSAAPAADSDDESESESESESEAESKETVKEEKKKKDKKEKKEKKDKKRKREDDEEKDSEKESKKSKKEKKDKKEKKEKKSKKEKKEKK